MAPRASATAMNGVRLVSPCGMPCVVCSPWAARTLSTVSSLMTATLCGIPGVGLEIRDRLRKAGVVGSDWRGVLYPARMPSFHRVPPPEAVATWVRWFWIPEWHLAPGRVSRQEVIAFPACNLAVEPDLVGLAGPTTRRSYRDLTGRGWAVGALLRPAAVPHFVEDPVAIRDAYLTLDLRDLHAAITAAMTSDQEAGERRSRAVDAFAHWLEDCLPPPGSEALLANAMADLIDG